MSNKRAYSPSSSKQSLRDEQLELSRAILLTTVSAGIGPTVGVARGCVLVARALIAAVDDPNPPALDAADSNSANNVRVPIGVGGFGVTNDTDDDTELGADLRGLEDLSV